jgi:hypothetical protein
VPPVAVLGGLGGLGAGAGKGGRAGKEGRGDGFESIRSFTFRREPAWEGALG